MINPNFKICVVSTSRAEFGLLRPLLEELRNESCLTLQFVVSGTHLSKEHGRTIDEIENTGITINATVDIRPDNSSKRSIAETVARTVEKFATILTDLNPDMIVILGDRYEIFGVASAAMCLNIPIAHLHGGELTEGAMDDAIRHAITKMANLHFVCAEPYRKRIIQMGEQPDRVFNTGALGVEAIMNTKFMSVTELEENLRIKFKKRNILIGYHSVTLEDDSCQEFDIILEDLKQLPEVNFIMTMPNADFGGQLIKQKMLRFKEEMPNAHIFENLGSVRYLSCLSICDILIGNSSSGLLEAPYLGCYTINVGKRQKGRLRAKTVTDVTAKPNVILNTVRSLFETIVQKGRPQQDPVVGITGASKKIASVIKQEISNKSNTKRFWDINFQI